MEHDVGWYPVATTSYSVSSGFEPDMFTFGLQVRSSHRGAVVLLMVTSVPGRCNDSISKPDE